MSMVDFKKNLTSINEIIYFDKNEYLREKTTDLIRLNKVISEAEGLLKNSNKDDTYFLYGVLGNLYRISEQPQKAMKCLRYCLEHAIEERNLIREIVSLIRLGEAFKYDNNHKQALHQFNKALEMCKTCKVDEYLDFVLQHKGKCLLELAKLHEAENCFVKALELRKSKGNPSLIDSTQQAIGLLRAIKVKLEQ